MYEKAAYGICKISKAIDVAMSPIHIWGLKHNLIIFVNGFWLVVSGFSLVSCDALQCPWVGWIQIWWLWRWEQILQLGNFMLWFWWTVVVFFFIMVCYISFWLCMHACMSCEKIGCYGKPIMRSLFWVFKHVLTWVSPSIVLFIRPYFVGLGISFVHLLGSLLWRIFKLKNMEIPK